LISTFTQDDPIHFAAGDLNVSRYVGSNPVNWNDPSGLATIAAGYAGQSRGSAGAITGNAASAGVRFPSGRAVARQLASSALEGASRVSGQIACQLFGTAAALDVLAGANWDICGAASVANQGTESETQTSTATSQNAASDNNDNDDESDDCKNLRSEIN
jgi:hypothetical protein